MEQKKEIISSSNGVHVWKEEGTVAAGEEANCIKEGIIRYYCEYDGCTFYREEKVAKTGHSFDKITVYEPTCKNEGYTEYSCSTEGCIAKYYDDFVDALDHNYKDVVVASTCDADGYTVRTCNSCKYTYNEYYKLNSNGEYVVDANGEKVPAYPAGGHKDADKDGNCDSCKVNIIKSCRCLCHKTNWLLRIIYKIVEFIWKLLGISSTCSCGVVHYEKS